MPRFQAQRSVFHHARLSLGLYRGVVRCGGRGERVGWSSLVHAFACGTVQTHALVACLVGVARAFSSGAAVDCQPAPLWRLSVLALSSAVTRPVTDGSQFCDLQCITADEGHGIWVQLRGGYLGPLGPLLASSWPSLGPLLAWHCLQRDRHSRPATAAACPPSGRAKSNLAKYGA